MTDIYGIDPEGGVAPIDVRNALVECFTMAHGGDLAESLNIDLSSDKDSTIKRESIITFLTGMFEQVGSDFNAPTKEDLVKVVEKLEEFSKNFRDPKIIEKHTKEITMLINKLP